MTNPARTIPVEIVFAPSWWHRHAGLTFDRDFFFHPARRVADERTMERVLYELFGRYGLGAERDQDLPEVGAVHLASGFLLSEMLGCQVEYHADTPPHVIPANSETLNVDVEAAFRSVPFQRLERLMEALRTRFGWLRGDVNWSGPLNLALDLRGQNFLIDMCDQPDQAAAFVVRLGAVCERFAAWILHQTGSTSISVNRIVKHCPGAVFLVSECSNTMISLEHYEEFFLALDARWSQQFAPFGIHHCGKDAHRFAPAYTQLPHLEFLDVGWGSDVQLLRQHLPHTFFSLRLSPVGLASQSNDEICQVIRALLQASGKPELSGFCCVNIDASVPHEKIECILACVAEVSREML